MDILLILLLSFLLRFIFIFCQTTDDYVHLWNIKLRKKIGNPWNHQVPDSLIDGKRGYPPLPHYIVSLFPEQYWVVAARLLNILYDCLAIIIAYYLTIYLFEIHLGISSQHSITPQIAVALLLATSPILMPVTARMKSFGGRSLGSLLSLLYFIVLGYGLLYNHFIGVIVSLPIGIFLIMSSQFALQNLVFLSVILGLIYLSPVPFFILILMGIICWFLPQLGIRDILTFKLEHFNWYRKNYNKGTTVTGRNKLSDILSLPLYMFRDVSKFIEIIFYKSSYIIAAYSLPPLLISGFILIRSGNVTQIFGDPLINYMSFVILGSMAIFFLTSLKPFLYLGQAERYFEYSIPFIIFLFVFLVFKNELSFNFIYYTFLLQIVGILINFIIATRQYFKSKLLNIESLEFSEVIDFLKRLKNLKILTIPTKLSFKISYYFDNEFKFYYRSINEVGKGFDYLDEDWAWFELPKPDMQYFTRKYNVNTFIIEKAALEDSKQMRVHYDFSKLKKIFENNYYLIFK